MATPVEAPAAPRPGDDPGATAPARFLPALTAIVGATGPTGRALAREMVHRGLSVRVLSRSESRLRAAFADLEVEITATDAVDAASLGEAIGGCDLVVDCVGLPPEQMADHPRIARAVARAAESAGARCLQVSSYWSFFPHRGEIVDESHPRQGGHQWFRWRREAEDILLEAGALVVHLPDFFGPEVHTGAVQMALEEAVAGKPMSAIGAADTRRETVFVPDAMRIVADLAGRPEAYGTDWALPGNGVVSARELARIASAHLGREVKVRAVAPWLLRALALFVASLRPAVPIAPHYAKPVRYEVSKLRGLLGEMRLAPLPEAVGTTLDWLLAEPS